MVISSHHLKNYQKKIAASVHERNIQILATEMYKVCKGMSPPHRAELFERRNEHPYNLRHNPNFYNHL